MSPLRRTAAALARLAVRIMPDERADWGRAMRAEIAHIEGDGAALRWALGCIWTGFRTRSAIASRPFLLLIRAGLAGVLALVALLELSVTLMVFGYKTGNLALAEAHQGAVAGDDYRRYAPLVEQMSMGQVMLGFVQFGLMLAGAAGLALGWRRAPWLLAAALLLQILGRVWMQATLPAYRQVFSGASLVQATILLVPLALATLAAFWLVRLRPQTPAA